MDVQTCQNSDLANGQRFAAPLLGGNSLEPLAAGDLMETRGAQIQQKSFNPRPEECLTEFLLVPRNLPKKRQNVLRTLTLSLRCSMRTFQNLRQTVVSHSLTFSSSSVVFRDRHQMLLFYHNLNDCDDGSGLVVVQTHSQAPVQNPWQLDPAHGS